VTAVTYRRGGAGHNAGILKLKMNFNYIFGGPMSALPGLRPISLLLLLSLCLLLAPAASAAVGAENVPPVVVGRPAPAAQPEKVKPIQDNSFLMEEAYNQEDGVVQHISFFGRMWNSKDWTYSFTQEWPGLRNPKHQFSYTVLATRLGEFRGAGPGLGDLGLNYRYQLVGSGDTRVAFAPRLSLLLPTGDSRFGRGSGGAGIQTNLPLSVAVSKHLVTHWNAGATIIPRAKNEFDERARAIGYNLGQSFIWLAHPRFNVMLETVWSGAESVVAPGQTQRSHSLLISPGVRWAHNLSNGLQIVPGVAVPMGVGPSAGDKGFVLYLSLEHPFKSPAGK
jgi:hypothetical protein